MLGKIEQSIEEKKKKKKKKPMKGKNTKTNSIKSQIKLSSMSFESSIESTSSEQEIEDEEEESLIKENSDISIRSIRRDPSRDDAIGNNINKIFSSSSRELFSYELTYDHFLDIPDFVPPIGEEDKYILTKVLRRDKK